MIKPNNILFLASMMLSGMVLSFSSCSHGDDGDGGKSRMPISFKAQNSAEQQTTRDGETSARPLNELGIESFTVYGINGNLNSSTFAKAYDVFPNYKVEYVANSANTTQSNSSNWEYVNTTLKQTIKYWDENKDSHYFWAIAPYGRGTFSATGLVGSVNIANVSASDSEPLYFTDPTVVTKSSGKYGSPVPLIFKAMQSRIRIGFYEALREGSDDGETYKVTELKFYGQGTETDGFSGTVGGNTVYVKGAFVEKGNVSINYSYDENGVGTSATVTAPTSSSAFKSFGTVSVSPEHPLATSSQNPTYAKDANDNQYLIVLPYENNTTTGLTVKCDYKFTTADSKTVDVTGKYATVPAAYCKWEPNKSYTYIFKISELGVVLYDVRVEAWNPGEVTNDSWHNW